MDEKPNPYQAPTEPGTGSRKTDVPLWRNPYVIAGVVGSAMLVLIVGAYLFWVLILYPAIDGLNGV